MITQKEQWSSTRISQCCGVIFDICTCRYGACIEILGNQTPELEASEMLKLWSRAQERREVAKLAIEGSKSGHYDLQAYAQPQCFPVAGGGVFGGAASPFGAAPAFGGPALGGWSLGGVDAAAAGSSARKGKKTTR